ncbi:MAG: DUF2007 domain-containing protein [Haliea sp.]|jgi:hypothetical protein|nr:DUF2007 domain-containing protein [Haliea sp.]
MVYTNGNRFIVSNARNILESYGFKLFVKNEYASSAIGEVSPFDSWVELWVVNDRDYDRACSVLENALSKKGASPWVCKTCNEENDESFDFCWSCGAGPA